MEQIEWAIPYRLERPTGRNNVKVKKTTSNGTEYTEIQFYDSCCQNITNGDYLKAGVAATRIYFGKSNRENGFKIGHKYKEVRYIRFRGWRERFAGMHELKFDSDSCLWYIE